MDTVQANIETLVNEHLSDPSHFLVDVVMKGVGSTLKVVILVDGDEGISINDCASLSRKISEQMEELIDGKFTLEVSSPGVDYPLTTERQYTKNIGRKIKVVTAEDFTVKGRLQEVSEEGILLLREIKKGKKKEESEELFRFPDIKKTTVLIEF